jgi:hypothetical protein
MALLSIPDKRSLRLGSEVVLYKATSNLAIDGVFSTPYAPNFNGYGAAGDYVDATDFASWTIVVLADEDSDTNGLKVYGSSNGIDDQETLVQETISGGVPFTTTVTPTWGALRFEYTNGGNATGSLSITVLGTPRVSPNLILQENQIINTDLIHVSKTFTFTGNSGEGAQGEMLLYSTTGRIKLEHGSVWLDSVVGTGGFGEIAFGTSSVPTAIANYSAVDGTTGFFHDGGGSDDIASGLLDQTTGSVVTGYGTNIDVAADIVATIQTGDITEGTMTVDFWYRPITANGALT